MHLVCTLLISAGFAVKKKDEKMKKKIKISRKASPSCALNNANRLLLVRIDQQFPIASNANHRSNTAMQT